MSSVTATDSHECADKLAEKGKLNFKLVQDAIKGGEIPKPILDAVSGDRTKAIKNLQKTCLDIFKDRAGTVLTIALFVPVLAISNRVFPIIADLLTKDNDD